MKSLTLPPSQAHGNSVYEQLRTHAAAQLHAQRFGA
jgi:hypothetical protein